MVDPQGRGGLFDCRDRVVLVTGASSGLGERFARVLDGAGARAVLTARRSDRLEALAHELTDPLCLPGDLTDPSHRQALVDTIEERYGRLDVLINNAGSCDAGPLEEQTLEELTSVIELNLVATIDLCRLAAPLLFRAPSPSVVNIASVFGVVASRPAMAAYNATKGALVNFTRHLAAQWGPRGVRVNALAPGYFPTELTGMLTDEGLAASIRDRTLLGRPPTMAEIDGPLLFLVSDASSYVTGHTLLVDGGWTSA